MKSGAKTGNAKAQSRGRAEENKVHLFAGALHPLAHMLSQKRARVLGFSWLRRCLNQRCMVLTSQSSCLDRPSNLFSSGCWGEKDRDAYFTHRLLEGQNVVLCAALMKHNNIKKSDFFLILPWL